MLAGSGRKKKKKHHMEAEAAEAMLVTGLRVKLPRRRDSEVKVLPSPILQTLCGVALQHQESPLQYIATARPPPDALIVTVNCAPAGNWGGRGHAAQDKGPAQEVAPQRYRRHQFGASLLPSCIPVSVSLNNKSTLCACASRHAPQTIRD